MSNGMMDIKDVANYLKIKEQTVYRLAQSGKIPALKIGGQWKVKKEHLDRMFDEILNEKLKELKKWQLRVDKYMEQKIFEVEFWLMNGTNFQ